MLYHKKFALLLTLICAGQVECSAGKAIKAISAFSFAGGTLYGTFEYRSKTKKLLANPYAKQALDMLNKGTCTLSFITTSPVTNGEGDWRIDRNCEFKDINPKAAFALIADFRGLRTAPVESLNVCCAGSCIEINSIVTRAQLEEFLKRVDAVDAPICGISIPGLRRLINLIATAE